jgi:hypothetical protein
VQLPSGANCRRQSMEAFEEDIFMRKSAECPGCEKKEDRHEIALYSSEVYDMNLPKKDGGISLCYTEFGTSNPNLALL